MNRRDFLTTAATLAACGSLPGFPGKDDRKVHYISLSFDDGFRKSFVKVAEIYENLGLSACLNVIATGHYTDFKSPDKGQGTIPKGDFVLWNELQARGHEIMPHSYKHAHLNQIPLEEAKDLIRRCLDIFGEELEGFDPARAVFNFPYNASTPELEMWLPTVVMAYRTGYGMINPLPHVGMVKLTTGGYGPENCEEHLDQAIEDLLARPSGWLIYNTHGLDDEGWGPIREVYLERLLDRLVRIETVRLVPTGRALHEVYGSG